MNEGAREGRFVVFEGGDGSGKSTVAAAVARRIEATGKEVVLTREPGGTSAGEQIRALLHDHLAPWAEAFAFLVARAQLVDEIIRPALARGAVVVCDRYSASMFAYQGYARGLDMATLRAADAVATGGLVPDLTVYLDVDPAVALARKRGEAETIRTGLENLAFHGRVRDGYLALMAEADPGSWAKVDASLPPEAVEAAAWAAVAGG